MDKMMTVKEVKKLFWFSHPKFKKDYRPYLKQNDYSTDIRVAFCDFVDFLRKDEQITEKTANDITL